MMENRERDDLNALTSQVLDYYKTYSQNRNFSSYLRGTIPNLGSAGDGIVAVEVREVANDEEETTPFVSVQSDNDENNINLGNVIEEPGRIPSPTSSVTSNRKLEWDNLADIGYGNCRKQKNLHKSLSLPLLTTLEKIQLGQRKLHVSAESNVIDHGTQTQGIIKNSPLESISSESYKKSSLLSSNTTTSFNENVPTIDTSSSVSSVSKLVSLRTETDLTDIEETVVDNKVLNSLQKLIGLPMAESTPNNVKEGGNTGKTGKVQEDKDEKLLSSNKEYPVESENVTELKCIAKCLRNNIKQLSLTKPLTVECFDHKQILDKDIQTSALNEIKTTSVAIQTDNYQENDNAIESTIYPVYEDRRVIEYVKHSDFPDEPSLRSVGTNTDSDLRISQCNSFEYLYAVQISDGSKTSKTQSNTPSPSPSDEGKSQKKGIATETEITSDLSSKTNPLAELISAKLSQHVVSDVEKSIAILQKLLKSKKYDKVTKQYYIKKIVQKIVKCNYSSGSSTNSATSPETNDNQNQGNTSNEPTKILTEMQQRQEAMPQMPVILSTNDNLKLAKRRQLNIKTFSSEILPEQPIIESSVNLKRSSKLKDARFTIASKYNQYATSDEVSQIGDVIPDNLSSHPPSPQTTMETSESSRKSSFKNWKEHTTKSEKLLEDKLNRIHSTDTTSDDSDLLNFAKKERENQISWINNEINHLNKLKIMLQKKKKQKMPDVEKLIQPQFEDVAEKNKTTSVYVITTERSSATTSTSYKTSAKSLPSKSTSKKCDCLYTKSGSLRCDSSDCPVLNYNSDKSSKRSNFDVRKDTEMPPPLTRLPDFEEGTGIENARLIASEIYPGETPNSCVRRYVFEMPMSVEEHTVQKQYNELFREKYICKPCIPKLPDCNIRTDTQNAKLIASDICKGSSPNTCIRRYIFEIPVCEEDVPCRKTSRPCSPRFVDATSMLSSYKKSNYSIGRTVTCRHHNLDKLKVCDCKPKPPPPRPCNCKEPRTMKDAEVQIEIPPPPPPSPPPPKKKPSDVVCIYASDDEDDDEDEEAPNDENHTPSDITRASHVGENKKIIENQNGKKYGPLNVTPGYQIGGTKQSVGPQNGKHYQPSNITPGYQIDESKQSVGPQNGKHYETTDTTPGYQIGETKQSVGRQNGNNYDPTNITPGYQMGERRKVIDRRTDKSYEPSNIAGAYQIDPSRKVVDSGNDRKYRATDIARGHQIDESKNIMERQIDEDQGPSDIAYVYQVDENGSKLLPGGIVQAEILADPNKDCQITVDQGGAVSYAEFSRTRTEEQKIPDMKQPTKYHVQPQSKPVSTEDPQPYVHTSSKKTVKISDQDDHYPSGGDRISEKSQEHKRSDGTTISSDADASSYSKPNSDHSPRAESLKSSYPAHSEDKHLVKGDFTQKLQSNGESYDKKPSGDRVVSPKSASAKTYKDEIIRGTEIKNHRKKLQEDDKKKHKNGPVRKSGQDTSSAVESMVTSASPTHSEKTVTSTDIKTDDKTQDSGESTSARTKDDEKSQESGKKPKKERVPIMCYRKGKEPPVLPAKKPPTVPVPDPSIESIPTVQAAEPPTSLQDRGVNTDNVETVTDSSESSDSSESIPRLCLCCNTAEAKYRSRLRGLPNQLQRALCDPCFIQNQQVTMPGSRPYYTYPGHVCCCYTMIKTETVRKIQRTVQELEDLDRERNLCSCTYGCKLHKHTGKRERCSKAVAYTLTFEDVEKTDSDDDLRRRHKRPPLEEVRVKIPHFVKKSKKDRENRKKSKHEKRKKHHKSDNDTKTLTLQDHLVTNRPNFIASAEERRQALIELAYMREERCQKYKQLLAMSNGVFSERNVSNKLSKPHMFSSKEMKKITANNYKKLPEVQKKLEENRNQQIKRANKILSDMFNRKLRERVLKGKLSLSTNTSVIKLT